MFRPIPAIIRFSSERVLVFIRFMWLCNDVEISSSVVLIITTINLLTPNVNYSVRTAPLTSKVAFYIFIQQIYVLNILNMVYTFPFFSSKYSLFHNSNVFGSCIIHILYIECPEIKKK